MSLQRSRTRKPSIKELPGQVADEKLAGHAIIRAIQANFDHLMGALRSVARGHNLLVDDVITLSEGVEVVAGDVEGVSDDVDAHIADTTNVHDHGSLGGLTDDDHTQYLKETDFDDIDFLVGTATGHTGAEIVAGTAPGGELGGTWASPTVDATHSGSTHTAATDTHIADTDDAHDASAISILDAGSDFTATTVEGALDELQADNEAHVAAADPHTGYVRENDANWTDLTDSGATTLHSHAGSGSSAGSDLYLVRSYV